MLTKTQFRVLFGFSAKPKTSMKNKLKMGTKTCFGAKRTVFKGKFGGRYVLRKNKFGKMSKVYIKAAPARRTRFGAYRNGSPMTLRSAAAAAAAGPGISGVQFPVRSTPALVLGPKSTPAITVTPAVQAMFGKSKSSEKARKKAVNDREKKAKKAKKAKEAKEKKEKKAKAKKAKDAKDKKAKAEKQKKAKEAKAKKDKAKKVKAAKAKKDKADKKKKADKKSRPRSRSPVRTSGYMGGPYSTRFGSYTTASPAQKMGSLRAAMGPVY